ncbi:hypothetical protein [Chryseobacterium aquaticum]|uniref:Uncharacterized protein n=1 Tax=Chryseobacterium aquaticum subsp. greenlandense TaxID=345663 RepID=A0A117KBU7_9FLAO|nr:hypothetical protein [Chryseobacterium aquaticum]KNB61162.1 hypothetical protein AC804_11270 [Chryseobacterium sp. Hurlbut01]KUJ56355.1 hypothetical protein AR686_07270 [Chryseobacterium aquaticum subsp. greenlandense]
MFGHLIKYSESYREALPQNLLDLVKNIPKGELITTIVAINSKINPTDSSFLNDSRATQVECIRILFLDTKNHITQSNCWYFIEQYLRTPKNFILFSRVTCLYSIQLILSSDDFVKTTPEYNSLNRENIFKFLLAVNECILVFDKEYLNAGFQELGDQFFEYFMFKELPHNQYYHSLNPINLFYKSYSFLKKLEGDDTFGPHFSNYLSQTFHVPKLLDVFKFIMFTYFKSFDKDLQINYLNIPNTEVLAIKMLDAFSERHNIELPPADDLKVFEFLSIKKSPLFKGSDEINKDLITYLILDNKIFMEKTYSLFINDFWFDYLKPNQICRREDWGNFVGDKFFEPFIENIFNEAFKNNNKIVFKHTDDLKISLPGRTEVEYADYYIRQNNKIILAEAKSNYLPVINGYKTVKSREDFDNLNFEKFYKDYGLTQLVKKTLKYFHDYKKLLNDSSFNFDRKVEIFPTLIVNDVIFSSGWSSMAFKRKFEQMLFAENIAVENDQHKINPLTIINVSDLQNIQNSLKYKKQNIFNIFRHYHSVTSLESIARNGNTGLGLLTVEHSINKLVKDNLVSMKKLDWLI